MPASMCLAGSDATYVYRCTMSKTNTQAPPPGLYLTADSMPLIGQECKHRWPGTCEEPDIAGYACTTCTHVASGERCSAIHGRRPDNKPYGQLSRSVYKYLGLQVLVVEESRQMDGAATP